MNELILWLILIIAAGILILVNHLTKDKVEPAEKLYGIFNYGKIFGIGYDPGVAWLDFLEVGREIKISNRDTLRIQAEEHNFYCHEIEVKKGKRIKYCFEDGKITKENIKK